MSRRRPTETISLSFLDVMSVGLGSVILIFLIIDHAGEQREQASLAELNARIDALQAQYVEHQFAADELGKALERRQAELDAARAELAEQAEDIDRTAPPSAEIAQRRAAVETLRSQLTSLETQVAALRNEAVKQDNNANLLRQDDGERQYLTGLKIGGNRILFLVDASASMLEETIVGVIRRRNLSEAERRAAPKWRRALAAVEWLAARLPPEAQFQIYVFNDDVRPVLAETSGQWLAIGTRGEVLEQALEALRRVVPSGGTSLYRAIASTTGLTPRTDNIYLLTDGLPTQGLLANQRGNVSPARRLQLFNEALRIVPKVVPVNVILLPFEGDPLAAAAYWQLARLSSGVLLSPTADWP